MYVKLHLLMLLMFIIRRNFTHINCYTEMYTYNDNTYNT